MRISPLVSIVTPSFNQAQFIEETLRSVEIQEYRPIHQIVVDGGSTDGTVELLKRWEEKDHGPGYSFEWISERDRGHADALNKGFGRVKGDVVGWLNSDNVYFDRQAITSVVNAFHAHPDVDVVFGEVALISENSGLQMILCYPKFEYKRAMRGYMISQPTAFLRRCVTDKYRLDSAVGPAIDFAYWLQIGKEHKFRKIHRILAGDRDQPARISRTSKSSLKESAARACAAFGAQEKPSRFASLMDLLWLRFLRISGLLHLLSLLALKKLQKDAAFPVWVDSAPKVLARQLTMRVNHRSDLGPRRPYSASDPIVQ